MQINGCASSCPGVSVVLTQGWSGFLCYSNFLSDDLLKPYSSVMVLYGSIGLTNISYT